MSESTRCLGKQGYRNHPSCICLVLSTSLHKIKSAEEQLPVETPACSLQRFALEQKERQRLACLSSQLSFSLWQNELGPEILFSFHLTDFSASSVYFLFPNRSALPQV